MHPNPESEPTTPEVLRVDYATNGPPAVRPSRLWLLTLTGSLVAAVATWFAGETSLVRVEAKKVPMETMGQKHEGTTGATELAALISTAGRRYGLLGALLGVALGAAGGLARGSGAGAVKAALVGAAGGLASGLVAYVGVRLHARAVGSFEDDLIPSLILHGAISIVIGLSGAFALGLGAQGPKARRVAALIGGGAGGLLGAVAFQIAGGLLLPTDGISDPIATTSQARLFSTLLVAGLSAIGATAGLVRR
ncbi:hypothetical protein [Paludisphaera soli]|uniref:hypothetical protein n=1 Tax=Paludisphaera soli TaxID=2712865 RepID=UPI0013EAE09B|nr:hypothetical protein [Paludisphaera soli]